jgi:phosphoglycolate phosphatase
MKYALVIFDLDGTLLNTLDDLADAANAALEAYGFPRRTTEEIRTFIRQLMAGQIENGQNSPESARETVRVIEKMRESAALDGAIIKL